MIAAAEDEVRAEAAGFAHATRDHIGPLIDLVRSKLADQQLHDRVGQVMLEAVEQRFVAQALQVFELPPRFQGGFYGPRDHGAAGRFGVMKIDSFAQEVAQTQ